MEHFFDFQFDFETASSTPPILEEKSLPEENDFFKEITQGSGKSYQCAFPGCAKVFKYKSEIARHSVIHQAERPYCCTFRDCNKSFKRSDALENHMRIHIGNLPYACDVQGCGKKFATKAAIRYHRIRHNNERIFKCELPGCDKSFLTSSQRKQHQKSCNLHFGFSSIRVKEEEPMKLVKIEPKDSNEKNLKNILKSRENIQWQVETQSYEDDSLNTNVPKKLEMLFSYLMSENKILKDQLYELEKLENLNEKKLKFEYQSEPQIDFVAPKESSSFFDDNELKFLEFLKGREC